MALMKDLIAIPERVHQGDFVLKLAEGVSHAEQTLRDYVVTPQLVQCFDNALAFIRQAVETCSSKAAYLHGSFTFALFAAIAAFSAAAQPVFAQTVTAENYPIKPIRIVVPFPPGAGTDVIGRAVGQALSEAWKHSVVIDNRAGAGGTIGSDIVAKANPDGHTLLLGNISTLAIARSLYPKLPYDPLKDFAPITLITTSHNVLVVHPSVAAKSVKELIALAKARPRQLNYGSAGSGTTSHLGGALFASMAGVELTHVPYKGSGPSLTDLIGGQLQLSFGTIATTLTHIRSGRLRALAVTSLKRSALLPELPTIAEAALPGYEVTVWQGIVAPAGTPKAIIFKLHAEIVRSLRTPEMKERLAAQGLEAVGDTPPQLAAFIRSEIEKWGHVVRASGAKPE